MARALFGSVAIAAVALWIVLATATVGRADQIIADDLIVQGGQCVGVDCINNEPFDFVTLRLKENNVRIRFEDTSTGAGFSTRDWEITINDSASGGADRFSILDVDAGRNPFTIEGNAPANLLYLDNAGRIGIKTSVPVLDVHVRSGNTPGHRLEQDASGGFTAQTWDIAGNEANFFIRDVTGGSRLPFRIRPGAPTSSLDISRTGSVGLGIAAPSAPLHLHRSDGTAKLRIDETSTTVAARRLLELKNNGFPRLLMTNDATDKQWEVGLSSGDAFMISNVGNGPEVRVLPTGRVIMGPGGTNRFDLRPSGDLIIAGTLTQGSSAAIKTDMETVDARAILRRLASLPLATWRYKADPEASRHLGPTAEDFHDTFGLGSDATHLAPGDLAGVALAAIQALQQQLQERDGRIADLQQRVRALESSLAGLLQQAQHLTAAGARVPARE